MEDNNYKAGDKLHIKYLPNTNNEDGGFDKIETLTDKDGVLFFGDKEFVFYDNHNELYSIEKLENNSQKLVNPIRNEKGQLLPGVKLNGAGKPKGARHFSTLIREAIAKVADGDDEPADRMIVKQLVDKARKGDLSAIDRVLDRVDGKAEQTITLDADVTTNNDGLSQEEREALLNLLK
jgi:hypothetical protein